MRVGININYAAGGGRPATIERLTEQVAGIERQGFDTAAPNRRSSASWSSSRKQELPT